MKRKTSHINNWEMEMETKVDEELEEEDIAHQQL
eukprot:gene1395-biopygen3603